MTGDPVAVPASYDDAVPPMADAGLLVSARPFPRFGTSLDRARAQQCLTTAIYYEAATEPTDGKRAVAQVVLNRVTHPAFPGTVCDVVYQGSERWTGCQFSFTCDGSMARVPERRRWAESAAVAAGALGGHVFAPVGLATHYHTWRVWPAWGRTLVSTTTVGAHIFHRLRGYWGTAAAFRAGYRGGEPMPGPHTRLGPPPSPSDLASAAPPPLLSATATPIPQTATPQERQVAARASSPEPVATVASARTALATRAGSTESASALPTSTVRPEYAESGRWRDAPAR